MNVKYENLNIIGDGGNIIELLMRSIFNNKEMRSPILKLWLSRRIIKHEFTIYTSKLFGNESIMLTNPHLEYLAIFEAISTLKYNISVSASSLTLFSNPIFKSRELKDKNSTSGSGDFDCKHSEIFSIPMELLGTKDIQLINSSLDKFKTTTKNQLSDTFCIFRDLDIKFTRKDYRTGDDVGLEYKRIILNDIIHEILSKMMVDSTRVSHIVYNKKYGDYESDISSSSEKKHFIMKHKLRMIYHMYSVICYQLEVVMNEVLDYNNAIDVCSFLTASNKYLILKESEGIKVNVNIIGTCEIYKSTIESVKEILISCGTYIKIVGK